MKRKRSEAKEQQGQGKHQEVLSKKPRTSESDQETVGHKPAKKKKNQKDRQIHSPDPSVSLPSKMESQKDGATASVEGSKRKKTGSCMKHKKKDKVLGTFRHDKHAKHRVKVKHELDNKPNISSTTRNSASPEPMETSEERNVSRRDSAEKVRLPKSPEEYSSNWKQLSMVLETQKKKPRHKKEGRWKDRQQKQGSDAPKPEDDGTAKKTTTPEVWFDDVDDILIDSVRPQSSVEAPGQQQNNPLVKSQSYDGLTKALAIDCEMVGVGEAGKDSILARISIVNQYGQCVYDEHVQATEKVTDYRTHVSGIRKQDLLSGKDISMVQKEVSEMLKGRTLVGHALHHDLQVLYLDHPRKLIRDTSMYKPFRSIFQGRTPSLKKLTQKLLNVTVQQGEHSSVQDAQAAMRLYTMYRQQWEKDIREGKHKPRLIKEKKEKKRNPSRLRRLKHKGKEKT